MRPVRAPTVSPMAPAATTATSACAQAGQPSGARDSAPTGIMTPTSQAPEVTRTQRCDRATARRRTRHCRWPMDSSAAAQAGTSTLLGSGAVPVGLLLPVGPYTSTVHPRPSGPEGPKGPSHHAGTFGSWREASPGGP